MANGDRFPLRERDLHVNIKTNLVMEMMKQLSSLVIAKYCDLAIICPT